MLDVEKTDDSAEVPGGPAASLDGKHQALDVPAPPPTTPGTSDDGLQTLIGLTFIAGVVGGLGWLIYHYLGGWWGVLAVCGLIAALVIPAVLPTTVRSAARFILVLIALVGIGVAFALPRISAHDAAQRRSHRLEGLAPKLCKMFDPASDAPLTAEESLIETITGGHDAGAADKIWAKLINEHCPASDTTTTPTTAASNGQQHFLTVARQSSSVLSRLSDSALLELGQAACTDLSNGPLAGAVADAESAGFDEFTAGASSVQPRQLCVSWTVPLAHAGVPRQGPVLHRLTGSGIPRLAGGTDGADYRLAIESAIAVAAPRTMDGFGGQSNLASPAALSATLTRSVTPSREDNRAMGRRRSAASYIGWFGVAVVGAGVGSGLGSSWQLIDTVLVILGALIALLGVGIGHRRNAG